MFRFLCIALLPLVLVNADYLYGEQPYTHNTEYASAYDNYKPRDYKFEYGVSDPHTGDHKSQWEVRENGVVRGAYSLLEADGTTRVVEYYADDTGFHADVKNLGTAVHDTPVAHIAPVVAPVIKANIADGIAYNGYGHGGLEHGYGAPIAAVQHVATNVIAPIEHLAKVQHIAPVQQVIEPLAQYAPIHYENYAPLLAKSGAHLAHEYKLEHQVPAPQYQPIDNYGPIINEAHIDKYSPIAPAYYDAPLQYIQKSHPIEQAHYIQKEQHYAPAPISLQKAAPIYHQSFEAPAQSLYSHEINYAPVQDLKFAQVPELKYAQSQEVKYAPAPELKYIQNQEVKYAPAPELKYVQSQELKYVPAPELKYAQAPAAELNYAQAQEVKYAPAPELKYIQAPAPQHYNHVPEQYNAPAPLQYNHVPEQYNAPAPLQYNHVPEQYNAPAPQHYNQVPEQYNQVQNLEHFAQANYAKENLAPIYYEQGKPQLQKSAPVDYEALKYYGAADGSYKPEIKSSQGPYAEYNHQGY